MADDECKERSVSPLWPVGICAVCMVVVATVVAMRLDNDPASIQPEKYARFIEGARLGEK